MQLFLTTLLIALVRFSCAGCVFVCWDKWSPDISRYEACTGDSIAPSVPLKGNFRQEICSNDNCTSGRVKGDWIASPGSWAWVWPIALGPQPNPPIPCPPSILVNTTDSATDPPCVQSCIKPGFYEARITSTVRGGESESGTQKGWWLLLFSFELCRMCTFSDDDGCVDHHFLGYINQGTKFRVCGSC